MATVTTTTATTVDAGPANLHSTLAAANNGAAQPQSRATTLILPHPPLHLDVCNLDALLHQQPPLPLPPLQSQERRFDTTTSFDHPSLLLRPHSDHDYTALRAPVISSPPATTTVSTTSSPPSTTSATPTTVLPRIVAVSRLDGDCRNPTHHSLIDLTSYHDHHRYHHHHHHRRNYSYPSHSLGTLRRAPAPPSLNLNTRPSLLPSSRSAPATASIPPYNRHARRHSMATTATLHHQYPFHEQSLMSMRSPRTHSPDDASPGSPPELTTSKSSKSSSLHSSSTADSIPHDLANFEDITLDDIQGDAYVHRMAASIGDKQRPHSAQKLAFSVHSRDLTTGRLGSSGLGQMQIPLAIPPKMQKRRRQQRPQPNSLVTSFQKPSRRARSVSPQSPSNYEPSPLGPKRSPSGPVRPGTASETNLHARRQSWQPGRRKTVKELEDEYDDLDEDLPEDAVIFNVPISPRPPQAREREVSRSPRHSWSPIASPLDMSKGLGLDFSSSGNPINVPPKPQPKSPRLSSLPRSVSMTAIPENRSFNPRSGVKSWDSTLTELSAEARLLTQVLEEHASEVERNNESAIQSGLCSPTYQLRDTKRSVSASSIELPPMRKGDLMIDPLPVSKEKEKVLTRTRPSWLPPKNPEEEKKHLKQYQKMMAQSLETERKRSQKQQVAQCKRDDSQESLARVWQTSVLPNWDQSIQDPKTRELWWKGIAPRDRGLVWQKAVGNSLGLTEGSYSAALQRAKEMDKRKPSSDGGAQQVGLEKEHVWFASIRHDVSEAFPELKIFQPGGPLHDTLVDVLMAYAMYRRDAGYVYGTHFTAALLILNLSASAAFITLANLLNRPTPSAFLLGTSPTRENTYLKTLERVAVHLPTLHTQLTNPQFGIPPSTYLSPMFTSLFATGGYGMDIASRIWDVYFFEGESVLPSVAAATLSKLEGKLYGGREEMLEVLRGSYPASLVAPAPSLNASSRSGSFSGSTSSPPATWDLGREDDFMATVREIMGPEKKKRESW